MKIAIAFLSFISIALCGITDSYYYSEKQLIQLAVGTLNSIQTQIPFEYQYLGICTPDRINYTHDSIGEIITGQRSSYTNYNININQNAQCSTYCNQKMTAEDKTRISWLIQRNYFIDWYLDFLPAGLIANTNSTTFLSPSNPLSSQISLSPKTKVSYNTGIPIGYVSLDKSVYLYNHYTINVDLHQQENKYQIVGFSIKPYSINKDIYNDCSKNLSTVNDMTSYGDKLFMKLSDDYNETQITFSYDVNFHLSNVSFASRWDHYKDLNSEIHWIGLINSNILIGVITFIVLVIFFRSLKRDIDIYNVQVTSDDFIDEFGWKQVCYDVFRKPKHAMILSSLVGTGVQLFIMIFYCLSLSVFGYLKPESRGSIITIMIMIFVFTGMAEGYISTWTYKMLQGKDWLKCTLLTAFFFPCFALIVLCLVNIMFSFEKSSATLTFTGIISLFFLWICCSTPLVFLGAFLGIKGKGIKFPCKVNLLPSTIPNKPWFLHIKYAAFIVGLIPFATTCLEFIYILQSLWRHQVIILAWFLFVAFFFLIITCAEISILFVYLNLCKGDHNWWWKSFLISGSPCIYFISYSIYYFFYLNITRFSAMIVYFALMSLLSSVIFLVCSSAGIIITFGFMIRIYSMIKID